MTDLTPILGRIKAVVYDRGIGANPRFQLGDKGTPEDYALLEQANAICSRPGGITFFPGELSAIAALASEWGRPQPMTREQMIDLAVRRNMIAEPRDVFRWLLTNKPDWKARKKTLVYYWIKEVRAEFASIVAGAA